MTQQKHTPGPISYYKCACGHRACTQYTLSTQGSVGFDEADARLYAAAPDLLQAANDALWAIDNVNAILSAHGLQSTLADPTLALRAAIAKATGADALREAGE